MSWHIFPTVICLFHHSSFSLVFFSSFFLFSLLPSFLSLFSLHLPIPITLHGCCHTSLFIYLFYLYFLLCFFPYFSLSSQTVAFSLGSETATVPAQPSPRCCWAECDPQRKWFALNRMSHFSCVSNTLHLKLALLEKQLNDSNPFSDWGWLCA